MYSLYMHIYIYIYYIYYIYVHTHTHTHSVCVCVCVWSTRHSGLVLVLLRYNATIYLSLYYYMCVLILLHVCPHTTIYPRPCLVLVLFFSHTPIYICPQLLYVCPHTITRHCCLWCTTPDAEALLQLLRCCCSCCRGAVAAVAPRLTHLYYTPGYDWFLSFLPGRFSKPNSTRMRCLSSLDPWYSNTSTAGDQRLNSRCQFVMVDSGTTTMKGPLTFWPCRCAKKEIACTVLPSPISSARMPETHM